MHEHVWGLCVKHKVELPSVNVVKLLLQMELESRFLYPPKK